MSILNALVSQRVPLTPYQGSFGLSAMRARRQAEQERAARAQEDIQRLGQGLQSRQLGLQRRGQDLTQGRFEATQQAELEAARNKERTAAFKSLLGNVMRQNQAGVEADRANLERLGFALEGGGLQKPQEPARAMPALSGDEAKAAEPVELQPAPGSLQRGRQLEERLPPQKAGGYRVVDRATGQTAWQIDDAAISNWQGERIGEAWRGIFEQEQDSPEGLEAAKSGLDVALGSIGEMGLDDAIKLGLETYQKEKDRLNKLETSSIVANRPRGGGGGGKGPTDFDIAKYMDTQREKAIRSVRLSDSISQFNQDEKLLQEAYTKLARGDALGNTEAIGAILLRMSGKQATDKEYARYAEATGASAAWNRIKGWVTGKGRVSDPALLAQLQKSLAATLGAMEGYRKESAKKAADYVMSTGVDVNPGLKRQQAESAGRYFYQGFSLGAPQQAAPAPKKSGGAPKTEAGKALMKLLED